MFDDRNPSCAPNLSYATCFSDKIIKSTKGEVPFFSYLFCEFGTGYEDTRQDEESLREENRSNVGARLSKLSQNENILLNG